MTLSEKQSQALKMLKEGNNVFVTGPGGCGKTYITQEFINYCRDKKIKCVVTAPTGAAAMLLNKGRTIHNFFSIIPPEEKTLLCAVLAKFVIK